MIKTLVACTAEADDEQLAVEQIKAQLGLEKNLLKNAVGIVACHYEFVLSGIAKAVCGALPFDVVGAISSAQSVGNQTDSLLLTLMVLTSDDVEFVRALTPSLLCEPGKAIAASYEEAAAAKGEKPALILAFAPFMVQNSGDEYVRTITEVSGGAPCFGTLAIDDTADFSNCFMLCNGAQYRDRMSMILVYGAIHPKFYIANISRNKILKESAVVTKSAGHVLMEVNERPVAEFFRDLGLTKASETQYAMSTLPFLLDYNDGTPQVSKIFIGLTPEHYAICAGAMPQGSTLHIAAADKEDVLMTTERAVDSILRDIQGASGLLLYSCVSRSMILGAEQYAEMELIGRKINGSLPVMTVCSGGEICPTQVSGEKAVNRFHNNACIACLF